MGCPHGRPAGARPRRRFTHAARPRRRFTHAARPLMVSLARLVPALTCAARRHPRLVVPPELEECGFGLIDWRTVPGRVAVELLHAAGRIARDGHAVAFTGRPYRTGPELTVDGRLTQTRYLTGQPGPVTIPAAAEDLLIAALDDLAGSTCHIAVVSAQPELSHQHAVQALIRWQHTQPPGRSHHSLDIYGHDWTHHQ